MTLNEQLKTKAFELFMRYGIRSVSMDDLARELGVSKKTIYQSVENKADLVEQLAQNHYEAETRGIREIQAATKDAMDELLQIAHYSIEQFRDVSPTMIYDLQKYYKDTWDRIDQQYNRFFYQVILRNLEEGRKQKLYREDFDIDIVARLFVLKTSYMSDDEIFPLKEYSLDQLVRENFSYHVNGVASHEGRKRMRELLQNKMSIQEKQE